MCNCKPVLIGDDYLEIPERPAVQMDILNLQHMAEFFVRVVSLAKDVNKSPHFSAEEKLQRIISAVDMAWEWGQWDLSDLKKPTEKVAA